MPLTPILVVEIFNICDIDFIGLSPLSFSNQYILLFADYVSKCVEAKATKINDAKVVPTFLKTNIFTKFGVPRLFISDQRTHFYRVIEALLKKYRVTHHTSTAY